MSIRRLHFVYNVELTPRAIALDFVHRIVDPVTYPCRLCDLTYGRFAKKLSWHRFTQSLPVACVFYTKDEFVRKFPAQHDQPFPVVLAEDAGGSLWVFLSPEELAAIESLDALQHEVARRLAAARAPHPR